MVVFVDLDGLALVVLVDFVVLAHLLSVAQHQASCTMLQFLKPKAYIFYWEAAKKSSSQ